MSVVRGYAHEKTIVFVVLTRLGQFIEIITSGIVGKGCAIEKTTCAFTRVKSILDWIKDNMK